MNEKEELKTKDITRAGKWNIEKYWNEHHY